MKPTLSLILISSILLSFYSQAQVLDTKRLMEPTLAEGECHTIVDSKIYLKDLKSANGNKKAIEEIGAGHISELSNSDDESYYFCKVKCNLQSQIQFVWLTQKDRNENYKNLSGFVCSGLDIQDVALSPTLTIKTTVATPYSAVKSNYPEIHAKLKETDYKLSGPLLRTLLVEYFNTLKVIHDAYQLANSDLFHGAADELGKYLPTEPDSWELTKAKIKELQESPPKKKNSLLGYSSTELVDMFFTNNAQFIRYVEN
ncbi:MAG: hypothetical protein B7Y39_16530 [Bdellovibrio sp. 28-41-41]|nr:MAG: hypothetical protein B7Y39_16530 [Bdellovibrio sp. 28-41-41]